MIDIPIRFTLDEAKYRYRHMYPSLSEDTMLADLFEWGYREDETYRAWIQRKKEILDKEYGVVKTVDEMKGWICSSAELWKPGVYKFRMQRTQGDFHYQHIGFCNQDILRVAIELGYLTKPL